MFRSHGTSFTTRERVAIIMIRLLTTMSVTAAFYGRSKSTIIGDFSLAFYESILGFLPMKFIEDCIKSHKPISKKKINQDLNKHIENTSATNKLDENMRTTLRGAETNDLIDLLAQEQQFNAELDRLSSMRSTSSAGSVGGNNQGDNYGDDVDKMPDLPPETVEEIARVTAIAEVRSRVISKNYKCPYCCRKCAWCIIIFWTLIAAAITTVYCIWFDVKLNATNELEQVINSTQCDENTYYDIPEKTWIEYNLTEEYIFSLLNSSDYYTPYDPPEYDSFGDGITTTQRFFYQLFLAYTISVFFTQPLILLIKAMCKFKKYRKKDNVIMDESLLFYKNKSMRRGGNNGITFSSSQPQLGNVLSVSVRSQASSGSVGSPGSPRSPGSPQSPSSEQIEMGHVHVSGGFSNYNQGNINTNRAADMLAMTMKQASAKNGGSKSRKGENINKANMTRGEDDYSEDDIYGVGNNDGVTEGGGMITKYFD